MATLTVNLPEGLLKVINAEVAAGGFGSPGDYIQDLLCRYLRDKAKNALEAELLRRIDDMERGIGVEMTDQDWAEIEAEIDQDEKSNHEAQGSSASSSQA